MRVLLDECLPRRLKNVLSGHETLTVPEAGWAGTKNGELLRLAAARLEVLITIDGNLEYQQNFRQAAIAVVVLASRSNRFDDLLPLVPRLLDALRDEPSPGDLVRVGV